MKLLILISIILFPSFITAQASGNETLTTEEINIRDPYIFADTVTQSYYMYAQMHKIIKDADVNKDIRGVEVYVSKDLKNWAFPQPVLILDDNIWARNMVWAPEMHENNGKYYLFVTLTSSEIHENMTRPMGEENWPPHYKRGTQIFVADSPLGPFKAFENKPHTPESWMALDGTLYVEDDVPYMIFCHEWVEIIDGSINYIQLTPDLSKPVGNPQKMFNASEAKWSTNKNSKVTDGCFLYRTKSDKLLMIWSSFGTKGYAIGIAESESGKIDGKWIQQNNLLFEEDGGHGMIFKTFDDKLLLAFHQPNSPGGAERLKLFEIVDTGDTLKLK